MDSFIYSLNATVPIFLLMILGNVLYRRGMLDRHFSDAADRLVFKVCLPCMLFMNLSGTDIRRNFDGTYLGFCFGVTLASILGIWALARLFLEDRSMVGAFVQGSYRSSAAILGIAFIENIYGSSEMAPLMMLGSVPLYNIFAVVVLTMENDQIRGQAVGEKIRRACIGVLENPIIIGILLGLLASYAQFELPGMLGRAAENLGAVTSPLALVSIGVSFQGRQALAKLRQTGIAAFLKLVGLAAAFLPLAIWLGFRDQKLIAIIIMLASPCTPTAYIMAKNMEGDWSLASSIVVVTTLLSSITLTGWIFLARCFELVR